MKYSLNLKGKIVDLSRSLVMGILNVTPDSFYAGSRKQSENEIRERAGQIIDEGGQIIDVGAYSTRPGAAAVSENEEMRRLSGALSVLFGNYPDAVVSVDTFRAGIAERCVREFGVAMINDISGGEMDSAMFDTVAQLQKPYILTHIKGTPQNMAQQASTYTDFIKEVFFYFSEKINQLHLLGVNDIIVDLGFGFSKNLEQNYQLLHWLPEFHIFNHPLLVGISRKSMIYKLLNITPEESLNATTVLNTYALLSGAHILRVHDVKAAVEAVKIVTQILV
ncbi:MAG: dihydropteroate synthase [Bacteroidales bacterium]|nr:dihydropteroate synthase [Bacteroidales bacterium]